MEHKDIAILVLNVIEASKKIVDNYDFYNEQDSDGLDEDYCAAGRCLEAFSSYYHGRKQSLGIILGKMHSYYEPYAAAFEGDTDDMRKAGRITDILLPGTALSAIITAFEKEFYPVALAMGTLSLVSYLYGKTRRWERKRQHSVFRRNDTEAKSITPEQLYLLLDSEKARIQEALEAEYEP